MNRTDRDRVDEAATDLEDLTTSVEEMDADPPAGAERRTIEKLQQAVEQANDAMNDLEFQKE